MNPVLMLCRNTLQLTKRAVESIRAQELPSTLYVVDNDSTDGTDEWLRENGAGVWNMRPAKGVSAAWNFGLDYLFNTAQCDKVLVINNDVELRPDTYRWLDLDGGPFVTAVSVGNPDGIKGSWAISRRPHPDFSCFLIRRPVWETVGPFDEQMALYASDADYHLRMHQAGIEAYTIGIPFYHYASGTLKNATEEERRRIQAQADADRAAFEGKWGCKVGSPAYYAMFGTGAPDAR